MKLKSLLLMSAAIGSMAFATSNVWADGAYGTPAKAEANEDGVYHLTDLTAEQFAENPAAGLWRFEKYAYKTGRYSLFTQYSDSNAANYVDIYQPCRVGGERVVEIDGLESWVNNSTFATVLRYGWSDYAVYNDGGTTNNSKERFCYVVKDEKQGYEVYANDEYASVISFTVPADGFYQVDARMIRQDVPDDRGVLALVARYRYATEEDRDYAHAKFGMCRLPFGQIGGEIDGYDGNAHISNGASQRYVAQQEEALTLAFEAKEGDMISFEVNTDSVGWNSTWARDFYGRAFYRALDITLVTEATARDNENFVDTYGESEDVETLRRLVDEYEDFMSNVEYGDAFGQYSQELADEVAELTGQIYEAIEHNQIHAFNASSYLEALQDLWRRFLESKVGVDLKAEGNYALYYTDVVTGELIYSTDVMAQNDDTPWGFYYYEVANGSYHKFANHDTNSKYGSAEVDAWYKGTGDWLYIADNGALHPMTNYAPAIMFTAPKDGVYKVNFGCYRPDPNPSVENPLWIRARFMDAETETQDKESYMFAKEYGSVANDGQGGVAPIEMEYFVNMKAGDKITWEVDCYTADRNSSAGTKVTTLTVCAGVNEDNPYTLENIADMGIDLFDAYSVGDPTELNRAIAAAEVIYNTYKDNIGTGGGQYSEELGEVLANEIAKAKEIAENGGSQYVMDQAVLALEAASAAFEKSRAPYEIFIEGVYAINIAGTDNYLTQKNKNASGSNYYAAFTNYAGIEADMTKNGTTLEEYNWTFTFKRIIKKVPTGEYDESTGEDITEDVEQTSVYGNGGHLTNLGYVEASYNEGDAPALRFFKYNEDDETFAIMNESGAYWNNAFTWKSPYDQINTTAEPNYIFVLSDMTLEDATGIRQTEVQESVVVSTEYFSLSGVKLSAPQQGVNIRVQKLANGKTMTTKVLIR